MSVTHALSNVLKSLQATYPELRYGQLITNIVYRRLNGSYMEDREGTLHRTTDKLFYITDEDLLREAIDVLDNGWGKSG